MGPRNHVLEMLRDVAIATNFGMQSAITDFWLFVGYNCGCMIGSDMLFDFRGWVFGIKLSEDS